MTSIIRSEGTIRLPLTISIASRHSSTDADGPMSGPRSLFRFRTMAGAGTCRKGMGRAWGCPVTRLPLICHLTTRIVAAQSSAPPRRPLPYHQHPTISPPSAAPARGPSSRAFEPGTGRWSDDTGHSRQKVQPILCIGWSGEPARQGHVRREAAILHATSKGTRRLTRLAQSLTPIGCRSPTAPILSAN
jgi:hypothetical protein